MKDYRRILSGEALNYIRDKSVQSYHYGKHMATYVSAFTLIMKTCKGRDKICSVIQYIAEFYYHCNKYSEIAEVLEEFAADRNRGAILAYRVRRTMKNTRKIFKFLKFIDQISSIVKNLESSKPVYLKIVSISEHLMACCSNFFDNIIWAVNVEVLDWLPQRSVMRLKANKYYFSLLKIIFKMLSNNY